MQNNDIHDVAEDISTLIFQAEVAADASIAAVANLIARTVEARKQTGVCSAEAQPTLMRLNRALSRAIDSNGDIARAHGDLYERYDEVAGGDTHPYTETIAKEAMIKPAAASTHLWLVNE